MKPKSIVDIIRENNQLMIENIALKKQISDTKIKDVAQEVSVHVNNWLDSPYDEGNTKQQDINEFALHITRYVDYRLHD